LCEPGPVNSQLNEARPGGARRWTGRSQAAALAAELERARTRSQDLARAMAAAPTPATAAEGPTLALATHTAAGSWGPVRVVVTVQDRALPPMLDGCCDPRPLTRTSPSTDRGRSGTGLPDRS